MFQQPDLFAGAVAAPTSQNLAMLIDRIAVYSRRPRYTFMVLNLIAEAAGSSDRAGPYVNAGGLRQPIRDWLCDALLPLAHRDPRRRAIIARVRSDLAQKALLPDDAAAAEQLVEKEVREQVRRSGRCNVSTAVSDLVRAGLLRRHYQGFRVDHHNRGAQREAVYTLLPETRAALAQKRVIAE
ncbi:MAG: hypothetical protein ABW169_07820 [Sphingobium sp.]